MKFLMIFEDLTVRSLSELKDGDYNAAFEQAVVIVDVTDSASPKVLNFIGNNISEVEWTLV